MTEFIDIVSFHAGMNRRVSPTLNKLEEARVSKNSNLEEIGTLKKDKGYSSFLNNPDAAQVLSLFAFYKIGATTTRYLLRDSNGKVYQANVGGGTWDAIAGASGLSTTVIPVWLTYKNLAIRFNGSDLPKKWDGTTFASLGGSPPNGSIAALFKDRVYESGASGAYSTIYFSNTGDPETWPGFNNFDVNANDGDRVMALMPLYDSLVIFKEFSMWQFQVDSKNNPSTLRYISLDIGTTSLRSIVNIGGIPYFFNRRGIYQFAGQYPELISLKVQPFIDAVANPYNVFGWQDGNKYNLYVGDVTVSGRSFPKCVIVYDTLQDAWTIRSLAHAMGAASNFINADNSLSVYIGSVPGATYKWRDGWSYAGTPVELEHETGTIEPRDPEQRNQFERIDVRSSPYPKAPVSVHYSIDGDDFKLAGQVRKTVESFRIRGTGTDIALRIHETSASEAREVYKIRVGFTKVGMELSKKRGK